MAEKLEHAGTTFIRTGIGHTAVVSRTDPDGTVHIEQHGKDHASVAVQSGSGGDLRIDQSGASAHADVSQDGECNATHLSQSGQWQQRRRLSIWHRQSRRDPPRPCGEGLSP